MSELTLSYSIAGMHCKGCARLVREILEEEVAGVKQALVSLEEERVELTCEGDVFDLETAVGVLEANGYSLVKPGHP